MSCITSYSELFTRINVMEDHSQRSPMCLHVKYKVLMFFNNILQIFFYLSSPSFSFTLRFWQNKLMYKIFSRIKNSPTKHLIFASHWRESMLTWAVYSQEAVLKLKLLRVHLQRFALKAYIMGKQNHYCWVQPYDKHLQPIFT